MTPLLAAALLAGCTLPDAGLEAASVMATGRVELGDGLVLLRVEVTAAPDDAEPAGTPDAPVELGPDATARTRLHRDHWVLRVALEETSPGAAAGGRVARLEWNGAPRPPVALAQTTWGDAPEGATLAFDVGARLEPSSLYVLRVVPAS